MNTPNLTFQAPQSDIIATVKSAKDPDIAVGAKVRVTGYVGIVTAITRRNTMGLAQVHQEVAHSFDLGELEFDERVAPFERQRVDSLPPDTMLEPTVWATLLGYQVLDWDGWNDMQRNLTVACTRQDFNERINKCTQNVMKYPVSPRDRAMDNFLTAATPKIKRTEPTRTPCCNYAIDANTPGPIFWNEYNKVVQCHNCGQVFDAPSVNVDGGPPEPTDRPAPLSKQRERLPDTRYAYTHKFDVGGQKGYVTVGFYDHPDDGADLSRPGEVFVVVQRQGSTLQGFADAWARSVSMLLQYGVPVSEVCRMFAYHRFEPRGITPNPDIRIAYSIVDYVARWLGHTCIEGYQPGGATELAADLSNEN